MDGLADGLRRGGMALADACREKKDRAGARSATQTRMRLLRQS